MSDAIYLEIHGTRLSPGNVDEAVAYVQKACSTSVPRGPLSRLRLTARPVAQGTLLEPFLGTAALMAFARPKRRRHLALAILQALVAFGHSHGPVSVLLVGERANHALPPVQVIHGTLEQVLDRRPPKGTYVVRVHLPD